MEKELKRLKHNLSSKNSSVRKKQKEIELAKNKKELEVKYIQLRNEIKELHQVQNKQ